MLKAEEDDKKVALLLSGCGYLDGSEVTEAVSCIIQLKKKGYGVTYFSLDKTQEEVYDHISKNLEKNEVRNMLSESTRITRTAVQKLDKLKPDDYTFLVVPGGLGVGRNLSNYCESPKV
jgi:enhancing lycopene biosynthesis protein 2